MDELLVEIRALELLHDYKLVTDPQDVGDVLNTLDRVPKFALDAETTGLNWLTDSIHGLGFATADQEWYVTGGAERAIIPGLRELCSQPDKEIIMHNAKFDLHFLAPFGIRPVWLGDTMIAQFLVDENRSHKLKKLAYTVLGHDLDLPEYKDLQKMMKKPLGVKRMDQVTIHDIPLGILGTYGGLDCRLTYDLDDASKHMLAQEGMTDIYNDIEMPFLWVLLDMEANGFFIDQSKLHELSLEYNAAYEQALEKWEKISGGVNPNSHKQLAKYIYKDLGHKPTMFTDSGQPSSADLAITRLLPDDYNGAIAALKEVREYGKLISTYITNFENMLVSGRLHGSFNQTGARTTRLSSSDPNLQNVPGHGDKGKKIRSLFSATPGYDMIVIDYSQVELRLLAHYSGDEKLMRVFLEGGDPHQMTADLIGISRFHAKAVNFGWAYGMGPFGLANKIESTGAERPDLKDTKAWLQGFSKAYPTTVRWKNLVLRYTRNLGYVLTIDGHKRRLPEVNSHINKLRSQAERQAVNSIIQGSAAAVIRRAMTRIDSAHSFFGARMLAQVHDEVVWECPKDTSKQFAAFAQQEMLDVEDYYSIKVPIEADPGIGINWAEAK